MVNLANINLGKDLSKLPLAERLNIMMHYRAADYLGKPTPISKLEFQTLDACIRTNEDIRAYNRRNNDYMTLSMQFDYIVKCVVGIQVRAHYFKLLWVANRQVEFTLDAFNHFLYVLQNKLEETKDSNPDYGNLFIDCVKDSISFYSSYGVETDAEGYNFLIAKFKEDKGFESRVNELNEAYARFEAEVAEYLELAEKVNLHLEVFTKLFPIFTAEAKDHMKWLERLEKPENVSL
jgi:hypothetical protein